MVRHRKAAHRDATASPPLWRTLLLFMCVFTALGLFWSRHAGSWLEAVVIGQLTVEPAAVWIRLITPGVGAQALGFSIRAPGGGIQVLNGCEGLDMLFLLWSGLLTAPLGWRRRLLGLGAGTVLVWALNQVRVVGLFYAIRVDKELFALLHGTVAPLLLVVCITLAFLALLSWRSPVERAPADGA